MRNQFIFLLIVLFLIGCTPYSHKKANLGNGVRTLALDASKRTIIAFERVDGKRFYCAEPSPDAMGTLAAAYAAALQGKSQGFESIVTANGTISTDVKSMFSRSQGIQALRDGLYRLCEAYANGAIEEADYRQQTAALTATLNFVVPVEICAGMDNATNHESFMTCVNQAREFATFIYFIHNLEVSERDSAELLQQYKNFNKNVEKF